MALFPGGGALKCIVQLLDGQLNAATRAVYDWNGPLAGVVNNAGLIEPIARLVDTDPASHPMEGWSAYCSSKAGLAMLTQSVAHEYGETGVLCFGFRPGVVDTGMQGQIRTSGINPISQLKRETLLPLHIPAQAVSFLFRTRPVDLNGTEIDIRDETLQRRIKQAESAEGL